MKGCLISVDVETTGPAPGIYSMYELGACLVDDPGTKFFSPLRPLNGNYQPEALTACGRKWEDIAAIDKDPAQVMRRFVSWSLRRARGREPVFVSWGSIDWMFVQWYLVNFLGTGPDALVFGHTGIEAKSFYSGMLAKDWSECRRSRLDPLFQVKKPHTHNALADAVEQAEIIAKMIEFNEARSL